ncbi:MAG: LysR family transcriptional regulator [Luteolibacter sp.]
MIAPEIREIQIFLALVDTGSFSGAAKLLGITQPAVSTQIAKLEQIIGFPLFHRSPEGTVITDQGKALIPMMRDIEREYTAILRRAAYWKRAQSKQITILADGSLFSRNARTISSLPDFHENWKDLGPHSDWQAALKSYEVDIVIAGSFLKSGDDRGIKTLPLEQQKGVTLAWNPAYYSFDLDDFSFPQAISTTLILPSPSLAIGFREFLENWCRTAYGFPIHEQIECSTELEAMDTCKLGLGVLILPGNAEKRLQLQQHGLLAAHVFESLLPKAFTFGIHYRAEEQNPAVLATVEALAKRLKPKM